MKKFITLLLVIVLTGCFSPTPNFYQTVSMINNETTYSKFNKIILVNQVIIPNEIARQQITTLGKNDYEVKIDEFNRWASQVDKMTQRVINENLSSLLPNAIVENQTTFRKNYDYAVLVEITEFSGRLDEKAIIKASYFIKNKTGKTIKSGKFNKTKNFDGGYDNYIETLSSLLGELSNDIAKNLL